MQIAYINNNKQIWFDFSNLTPQKKAVENNFPLFDNGNNKGMFSYHINALTYIPFIYAYKTISSAHYINLYNNVQYKYIQIKQ